MSQITRKINKITGTVISISGKIIVCALIVLVLYEGTIRGYQFGHEVFCPTAIEAAPGTDKEVEIKESESLMQISSMLKKQGLIKNEYVFLIQSKFYGSSIKPGGYSLNTSMTSKEILEKLNQQEAETKGEKG